MPRTITEWLKKTEIFSSLHEKELDLVAGYSEYLTLDPGQTVFDEGDHGGVLYIIVSGDVQIFKKKCGCRLNSYC